MVAIDVFIVLLEALKTSQGIRPSDSSLSMVFVHSRESPKFEDIVSCTIPLYRIG